MQSSQQKTWSGLVKEIQLKHEKIKNSSASSNISQPHPTHRINYSMQKEVKSVSKQLDKPEQTGQIMIYSNGGKKCQMQASTPTDRTTFENEEISFNQNKIQEIKEKKQQQKQSQFKFLYTQGKPQTLVMLRPLEKMLDIFIQDKAPKQYVCIDDSPDSQWPGIIQRIFKQIELKVLYFHDMAKFHQYLKQNREKWKIILCSPATRLVSIDFILQKIHKIITYSQQTLKKDQPYFSTDHFQNFEKLKNFIKQLKPIFSTQKQSNNFLFIDQQQTQTSHKLMKIMYSMLNQQIDLNTKNLIVDELEKLYIRMNELVEYGVDYFSDPSQIQRFISELKGEMTPESAIFWYTYSKIFNYKIVNSLLRSARHSSEIFYIQPFFKNLFNAVRKMHYQQKLSKKPLVSYRGAYFTRKEIQKFKKNKNKTVLCLSFLSTSFSLQMAKEFNQSTLLKINFPLIKSNFSGLGYAEVSRHSFHSNEMELLVNPLSAFSIKDVNEQNGICIIQLQYVVANNKIDQNLSTMDYAQKLSTLAQLFHTSNNFVSVQGQGQLLKQQNQQGNQDYWKKYEQILNNKTYEKQQQYSYFYKQKMDKLRESFNSQQATKYLQQWVSKDMRNSSQDPVYLFEILEIYGKLKNKEKVIEILEKLQNIFSDYPILMDLLYKSYGRDYQIKRKKILHTNNKNSIMLTEEQKNFFRMINAFLSEIFTENLLDQNIPNLSEKIVSMEKFKRAIPFFPSFISNNQKEIQMGINVLTFQDVISKINLMKKVKQTNCSQFYVDKLLQICDNTGYYNSQALYNFIQDLPFSIGEFSTFKKNFQELVNLNRLYDAKQILTFISKINLGTKQDLQKMKSVLDCKINIYKQSVFDKIQYSMFSVCQLQLLLQEVNLTLGENNSLNIFIEKILAINLILQGRYQQAELLLSNLRTSQNHDI